MTNNHKTAFDTRIVDNNISIELPEIKKGDKTSVRYNGVLTNSGAEKVYLHYGYDGWQSPETVPMRRDSFGNFTTEIKVNGNSEMNFCFKDNANNWDNNNGANWKVEIES